VRRPAVLLVAVALIAGGAAFIVISRDSVRPVPDKPATVPEAGNSAVPPAETPRPKSSGGERHAARSLAPFEPEASHSGTDDADLLREAPRAPLSGLGQAGRPKAEDGGTVLSRPLATAAGTLEARGYKITLAGIDPVGADETCDYKGKSWPCGMRARSAFRAWLRGRSISCDLPLELVSEAVVVPCRVGKQDIAAWLVDGGWARASAAGPYAASGNAAAKAGKGIFGAPPSMTAPAMTAVGSDLPAPAAGSTILSEPVPESPSEQPTPPSGQPGAFPPAPAPPPAPAQ